MHGKIRRQDTTGRGRRMFSRSPGVSLSHRRSSGWWT